MKEVLVTVKNADEIVLNKTCQMIDDTMINWNDMMAASILASIPLILVFLFCQNLFFSGLTAGGVKQ